MDTNTLLAPEQARRLITELHAELGTQNTQLLEKLIAQLDSLSCDCSVAQAHQAIAPQANLATANKALDRLLTHLNACADAAHKSIKLVLLGAKRQGVERRVRFVGQAAMQARAETNELQATRNVLGNRGEIEQYAISLPKRQRVLIVTASENETYAVYQIFGEPMESSDFDRLRDVGHFEIYHQSVTAGSDGLMIGVLPVIPAINPTLIVALGMAFGCKPKEQEIAQVLVATQVQDYELRRVGKDKIIPRGAREGASEKWLSIIKRTVTRNADTANWPKVEYGLILSGNTLVANEQERNRLTSQFDNLAIGGDMETAALAKLCKAHLCHWLMIKGIADFGDEQKPAGEKKQLEQRMASTAAARVLLAALNGDVAVKTDVNVTKEHWPNPTTKDFLGNRAQLIEHRAAPLRLDAFREDAKYIEADPHPALTTLLDWLKTETPKRYFAVLGEYGMGKTVLCQRLNCVLMEKRAVGEPWPLPLYFDLRRVTGLKNGRMLSAEEVITECIDRGWQTPLGVEKPKLAQIGQWIAKGALIIFDGLDEVLVHLSEADGQQFVDQLLRLLPNERNAQSRMLLSCRSHFFRSLREQHSVLTERGRGDRDASQFESMLLLPFNDQQIREYLSKALPGADPDQLLATLRAVHNLEELAARPVLLKNIVRVMPKIEGWRASGRKVYGVTLYREFVLDWLERDKAKHHMKREHKIMLARDLAAALWRRGQKLIPINELENWFADWRAELEPSIARQLQVIDRDKLEEDLRNSHFLTREDGKDEESSGFRFAHSSIQEYFLADYLFDALQNDQPRKWALKRIGEECWNFFGQFLAETTSIDLTNTLKKWRDANLFEVALVIFDYAAVATKQNWPAPDVKANRNILPSADH